jgi:hypothetical protein
MTVLKIRTMSASKESNRGTQSEKQQPPKTRVLCLRKQAGRTHAGAHVSYLSLQLTFFCISHTCGHFSALSLTPRSEAFSISVLRAPFTIPWFPSSHGPDAPSGLSSSANPALKFCESQPGSAGRRSGQRSPRFPLDMPAKAQSAALHSRHLRHPLSAAPD